MQGHVVERAAQLVPLRHHLRPRRPLPPRTRRSGHLHLQEGDTSPGQKEACWVRHLVLNLTPVLMDSIIKDVDKTSLKDRPEEDTAGQNTLSAADDTSIVQSKTKGFSTARREYSSRVS